MVLATCGASQDSWAEVRGVGAARLEAAETPNRRRGRREDRARAVVGGARAEEGRGYIPEAWGSLKFEDGASGKTWRLEPRRWVRLLKGGGAKWKEMVGGVDERLVLRGQWRRGSQWKEVGFRDKVPQTLRVCHFRTVVSALGGHQNHLRSFFTT